METVPAVTFFPAFVSSSSVEAAPVLLFFLLIQAKKIHSEGYILDLNSIVWDGPPK